MRNKGYLRKLDEILHEIMSQQQITPIDSLLNKVGSFETEKGTNENGDWVKTTYTSNDGTYTQVSWLLHGKPEKVNIDSDGRIENLQKQLEKSVQVQDFEKAAKLRDEIKSIKSNKMKIETLKKEMETAIKTQNFERAIEIRDELKTIH